MTEMAAANPADTPARSQHTYYLPRSFAHEALFRAEQFNNKMGAKGIPGRVNVTIDFSYRTPGREEIPPATIPFDLSTHGEFKLGTWRLVGIYEFPRGAEGTPLRWGFPEHHEHPPAGDCRHCEHCNTKRARRRTFVIADDAGNTQRLGTSCVEPFTGFDPTGILEFLRFADTIVGADPTPRGITAPSGYATTEYVAAARAASRVAGYVRTSEWRTKPTRDLAKDILAEKGPNDEPPCPITATDREQAAAAVRWARNIAPTNDFEHNLRAVASGATVSGAALGVAAYIPTAHDRWLGDERLRALTQRTPPTSVPESDTARIVGEVVAVTTRPGPRPGTTTKRVTVYDDRGFAVTGATPPATADPTPGDRVAFGCRKLRRNNSDPTVGYYRHPSKWETLHDATPTAEPDTETHLGL